MGSLVKESLRNNIPSEIGITKGNREFQVMLTNLRRLFHFRAHLADHCHTSECEDSCHCIDQFDKGKLIVLVSLSGWFILSVHQKTVLLDLNYFGLYELVEVNKVAEC